MKRRFADGGQPAGRWLTATRLTVAAIVLAVVAIGISLVDRPQGSSGDATVVVDGAWSIARCVGAGVWVDCDPVSGVAREWPSVGPYPPPQYVVAATLQQLISAGTSSVIRAFGIVSFLAFAALLVLAGLLGRRTGDRRVTALLVLALVASPLPYYATSTFGEMLAALLIVAALAACLLRAHPLWIVTTVVAACATKETLAPLLVPLGLVAVWATPIAHRPFRRSQLGSVVVGAVVGLAGHALFNLFRYGVPYNTLYFGMPTPGTSEKLDSAAGLWVAPTAGLLWYWPVAAALLVAAVAIATDGLRRTRYDRRSWLPAAVVVVVTLGQTVALASWFAPFGWIALGSRLVLPLTAALVVVLVICHHERFGAWLRGSARQRVLLGSVAAAGIASALAQIAVLNRQEVMVNQLQLDNPRCVGATIEQSPERYFGCLSDGAWRLKPLPLDALPGLYTGWGLAVAAFAALAMIGLTAAALGGRSRSHRETKAFSEESAV